MIDEEHKKQPAVSQARSLLINFDLTLDQYYPRLNKIIKEIEPLKLLWDTEKLEEKFYEYLTSPSSKFDQFIDSVQCTVHRDNNFHRWMSSNV